MKTKDVLLVVGGIALGYYASKMNFGKNTASAVENVGNEVLGVGSAIVTDVKVIAVDTKKTIECEKKWQDEIGSVSRLSVEALQKSKSDYVKNCIAL